MSNHAKCPVCEAPCADMARCPQCGSDLSGFILLDQIGDCAGRERKNVRDMAARLEALEQRAEKEQLVLASKIDALAKQTRLTLVAMMLLLSAVLLRKHCLRIVAGLVVRLRGKCI